MTDKPEILIDTSLWSSILAVPASKFDDLSIEQTYKEAAEAKRIAEERRKFVVANFRRLKGVEIPVEIMSVQNLISHNCLIVNDMCFLSYVEAEAIIKDLLEKELKDATYE